MPAPTPLRLIKSVAPVRICDHGGWTDTWFSGHGQICNIAVLPGAEVQLIAYPRASQRAQVQVYAENYAEHLAYDPAAWHVRPPLAHPHPLIAAALAEIAPPANLALDITIRSDIPAGASTGTSAAVTVALLGALAALHPAHRTPHEIAAAAHRVETVRLGLQCGIQDQLCAAYGGINFIDMTTYPHARVEQLHLPDALCRELERRLVLVFLGAAHQSSAVHTSVIARLEREGDASPILAGLRNCAVAARDALCAGNWHRLGQVMAANTELQRALHPALVSAQAQALIALAQAHGVVGWKVNGAGGAGGSVTLLCDAQPDAKHSLLAAIPRLDERLRVLPIVLSPEGLRVWEST